MTWRGSQRISGRPWTLRRGLWSRSSSRHPRRRPTTAAAAVPAGAVEGTGGPDIATAEKVNSLAAPPAVAGSASVVGTTCAICHDTYRSPVVLVPCGHIACASCCLDWLSRKRCCAECRAPVATVVQCPALQQLIDHHVAPPPGPASAAAFPSAEKEEAEEQRPVASRQEIASRLQELGLRDLSQIPLDYHGPAVHETAVRAVKRGDLGTLEMCLSRLGARASSRLLCYGAMHWRQAPARFLSLMLAHGVRINGNRHSRPMHGAILAANNAMVTELIKQGADLNKCGRYHEAPLHVAVSRCKPLAVQLLLKGGARDDVRDQRGQTPRMLATRALDLHRKGCSRGSCQRCDERRNMCLRLCLRPEAAAAPQQSMSAQARLAAVLDRVRRRAAERTAAGPPQEAREVQSEVQSEVSEDSDLDALSDFGSEASFHSELEYATDDEPAADEPDAGSTALRASSALITTLDEGEDDDDEEEEEGDEEDEEEDMEEEDVDDDDEEDMVVIGSRRYRL
mmetsp:Transcript_13449/g.35720  ORF Transcript_13449/g.35720 Transcript_13449/m.35720 type:complete len:511 (+) Transcript_13449:624-2156(+)